ncbi:MAG: S-ribosylhomocysteine lyase [Oscillospiraceae bacterium]|nr:S-ribosylhomocysteine lyase [Candidatus Ruminococcus equi]
MKLIKSFEIDHDKLEKGLYISRIDADIVTFDMRFVKPNTPPYLPQKALHTIEHLVATYVRNSEYSDNVVYFGPMGCRTGFYILLRGLDNKTSVELIKNAIKFCKDFEGEIPGSKKKECGNYLEHDLKTAKELLEDYYEIIKEKTENDLEY